MPVAETILVRGVNWLGDAVMTTPALQRLREARPGARITLLTHRKLAELWRDHPCVDEVMPFDGEPLFTTARRLRAAGFAAGVAFPNSFRSALELFFAGIPIRVGYARGARRIFLTHRVPCRSGAVRMHKRTAQEIQSRVDRNLPRETFPASAHHVHDYLQLVAALGVCADPLPPLLCVSDAEVRAARARFELGPERRWFALNPGAEYGPAKRWPLDRFIEAAVQIHRAFGGAWLILGGAGDGELARQAETELQRALSAPNVRNLAGQTSLRELCAVLKSSALLLSNDTGPMHVAAALGTPVVVPFGSTSPELTGPMGDGRHEALAGEAPCAPCFLRECPIDFRCMRVISVERVVAAVRSALGAGFV